MEKELNIITIKFLENHTVIENVYNQKSLLKYFKYRLGCKGYIYDDNIYLLGDCRKNIVNILLYLQIAEPYEIIVL